MPCAIGLENYLRVSKRTTNVEKARFRSEFERSLRQSMRLGQGLERAFGVAWEHASEEVPVSEVGQSELFAELIKWAKNRRK
jgi:hypothetical protein